MYLLHDVAVTRQILEILQNGSLGVEMRVLNLQRMGAQTLRRVYSDAGSLESILKTCKSVIFELCNTWTSTFLKMKNLNFRYFLAIFPSTFQRDQKNPVSPKKHKSAVFFIFVRPNISE